MGHEEALLRPLLVVPARRVIAPNANADLKVTPQIAGRIVKLLNTKVTGTINVDPASQLAGVQCSDITLYAESVDHHPGPPGGFPGAPKWTRHGQLGGTNINACTYSLAVTGNSAFTVYLGSDSTDKCQIVTGQPTPNAYVQPTVP